MLWDPRNGKRITTLCGQKIFLKLFLLPTFPLRHTHKNTVNSLKWNANGNWLLSASRDHLVKLFDLRAMKELRKFAHKAEVMSAYHDYG